MFYKKKSRLLLIRICDQVSTLIFLYQNICCAYSFNEWNTVAQLVGSKSLLYSSSLKLCCDLEEDTLYATSTIVLVQHRKTSPDMTEKLLTGT